MKAHQSVPGIEGALAFAGPQSGAVLARHFQRRKADVLATLRALEGTGRVERVGGGADLRWRLVAAGGEVPQVVAPAPVVVAVAPPEAPEKTKRPAIEVSFDDSSEQDPRAAARQRDKVQREREQDEAREKQEASEREWSAHAVENLMRNARRPASDWRPFQGWGQ